MFEDGVWRTVGGRRIFIKNGQSLSDAMKASGKFKGVSSDEEPKIEAKRYETLEDKIDYIKEDEEKLIDAIDNSKNSEEAGKRICEVLQERQGFNAKPQVMDEKDFNGLSDDKYIKLYRGVSDGEKTADEYIDQFKNGENQYGTGLNSYGVGHYASTDGKVAGDYGKVMEMALPKDAKIATINMNEADPNDLMQLSVDGFRGYTENMEKYYNKYGDNVTRILDEMEREPSTFAILEGYDAVRVIDNQNSDIKGETYFILNRGKVVVKK